MRAITFDIETRAPSVMRGRLDVNELELTVVGIHDSETGTVEGFFKDDLPKLWPILERADLLIGYNSDAFDIPLLNRYYPGDLTRIRSLDLMVEVQKVLGRRLRLQSLAEATLNKGKSGNGLEATVWWEQGLHDKVRDYCLDDVRITRELYDYAMKHGALKYKDLGGKRDIKIDTGAWEDGAAAPSMTHTLPF
jgi:DEAD/DEAH box helicase domain-containing protein